MKKMNKNMESELKIILFIVPILLMSTSMQIFANGGPVAWTETTPVGAIGFEQNKKITLKQELLTIRVLNFNTYAVKAEYTLLSLASVHGVRFGVPINWYEEEDPSVGPAMKAALEKAGPPRKIATYIRNKLSKSISIQVNGKSTLCSPLYNRHVFRLEKPTDIKFGERVQIKSWCVSKIDFKKGINKVVLRYKAQMSFEDMQFTKSALTEFSDRKLKYLLYPAGYWNGTVDNIEIRILLGPYKGFVKAESPGGFIKNRNILVWKGKKVDLKKTRKVEIKFYGSVPAAHELATWNKHYNLALSKMASVRASSTLSSSKNNSYQARNVLDGKLNTAWCEGKTGGGVDEYLEFKSKGSSFGKSLKDFCGIQGLMITTGYMKNKAVYMLNNRVSKIAISDCNGKNKSTYSLTPTKDYRFSSELVRNEMHKGAWEKFIKAYRAKHGNDFTHPDYQKGPSALMDFIKDSSCFRVQLVDIIKAKSNDTCISEVSLVLNCG